MKFNTELKTLGFCETVFESAAEQALDADISLPDYCPEIKRILKCCVCSDVISVQNSNGKITAQANATVRIIYIGDNDSTAAFEQVYPVQKIAESDKVTSSCAVDVRINTDYVNCRAVSPRRVDIRAMLSFMFKAVKKHEETVLSGIDGSGIQVLSDSYNYLNLTALTEKAFNLTEVIELPDDKPVIGRIINSSACVVSKETKLINNKMLLKGDCYIKVYYLSDGNSVIESAEHSIPVSQIIEVDGVNESCDTNIILNVTSCEAAAKVDSSGEMKLVDLNIRVSACVMAFENTDVTLITDAYSTDCEISSSFRSIEMLSNNSSFDTSFTNKVVLESIGVSVDCVNAVWCNDLKYAYSLKNNKCIISGNYQATIIYKDSEKQTGIIQKPVEFDYSVDLKQPAERIVCYPSLQITGCSCSVAGESKLEIKTEICISGIVVTNKIVKYISNVEALADGIKADDNCALTLYFTDENEKIWNIAKKYKTTVEAIAQENGIESDIMEAGKILLIPSV